MKIEIEIDEKELQERVTDIVAKAFFSQYTAERHVLRESVDRAVKEIIMDEKEKIRNMAVEGAARKLSYGAAPKVVEKLAKLAGEKNDGN